jgi:peptidoglycan/LPS O-acetylase OafA/YrhL
VTGPAHERRTIEYQPALDGVRAVAVALVLVFHGGATWMTGGYVGVSVFFTLSGYLITSLLLVEHGRTGTIALGRFYARRMKRLLPASLACLVAVAIAAAAGAFDEFTSLRRDLLGALFQVANWVKLWGDDSYADLTNATLGRVAPLEHYWSLAIEEQFYWLWPLAVIGLFRVCRSAAAVGRAIGVLAVVAVGAAPVIAAVWGPDAAYWATPARAGEILVGAALAALFHVRGPWGTWSVWLAPLCLAVVGWAATTWPAGSGPAYDGWFGVFALASVGLIAGLQHASPLRAALSARPVVWVGTISYGLYLYHWPIFAVLTEERVGGSGLALFAVRLAVTFVVAALSSVLLEQPVRRWDPSWSRPLVGGAFATAAVAALVVVGVQPAASAPVAESRVDPAVTIAPVDGTLAPLATIDAPASGPAASTTDTVTDSTVPATSPVSTLPSSSTEPAPVAVPPVSRPVRIMVVGDSTAQYTAAGLAAWAADHPESAQVTDASVAGCGFLRTGTVPTDGAIDFQGQCDELLDDRLPALLAELQPDVVMLMVTMRDVEDREWDASEGPISPFDQRFRDRLLIDYTAMADRLVGAGVRRIAWVLPPHPIAPFQGEQVKMLDPARYEVQFGVIDEVAAGAGDTVQVLDLRAWLEAMGGTRDGGLRPDGLHWSPEAGYWVAERYLAGSLVSIALS